MAKDNSKKEDIGCVPSTFWFSFVGARILCPVISLWGHIKIKPDKDFLQEEGPIIVISTHVSFLDPVVIERLTHGRKVNYVIGEFLTRKHFWGWAFKKGGAIPKKQFVTDPISVKSMMKVLKRKGVLVIYPEATRFVDGHSIEFDDGVAKLAKKAGASVYVAHIHGGYLNYPRWTESFVRKGPITAEFVRKIKKEEISNMTSDEIQAEILKSIKYNENDWARENKIEYKSKKLAAGLQNIAHKCPKCNEDFAMEYEGGDLIKCSKCGNEAKMLPTGLITTNKDGDKVFEDLHQWTLWEKSEIQKEIENGSLNLSLKVNIFKVFDEFTFANTGSGTVTVNSETIIYDGTDCPAQEGIPYKKGKPQIKKQLSGNKSKIIFDIKSMRGLVASYGSYFEIYDKSGELYRFYTEGNKVYKVQQIVNLIGKKA